MCIGGFEIACLQYLGNGLNNGVEIFKCCWSNRNLACREGEGERSGLQGRRMRKKEFAGKEKEKEDVYR